MSVALPVPELIGGSQKIGAVPDYAHSLPPGPPSPPQKKILYAYHTDYFIYVHSFSRDFRLQFWVEVANPQTWGWGGRTGSGIVPFEKALVSSYRPSRVTFLYLYAFQRYCRFCSPARHFFPTPPLVSPKFPHVPLVVGGSPFDTKSEGVELIRPPGTISSGRASVLPQMFFRQPHLQGPSADRRETLPHDRNLAQKSRKFQKFGGRSPKKYWGQKHAKFRSIFGNVRLWLRISPERLKISNSKKDIFQIDSGASTPLKHGCSLRPWKNEGGTKIMHIFVKIGGKEIKGEERLNYLSTYLHCLPQSYFLKNFLARSITFYFHPPISGRGTYRMGTVKSVSTRLFSVPLLMTWCHQIDHTKSKLNTELYAFSCTGRQSCREQDN